MTYPLRRKIMCSSQLARQRVCFIAAGVAINAIFFALESLGSPPDQAGQLDPEVIDRFEGLTKDLGRLDWDVESAHLQRAIKNVWQRNEWTSEADRFALDLACRLATIPPWKPLERLQLCCERVEARYGLTGKDRLRFRMVVMGEAARFLMDHAGPLVDVTRDWLETRVERRPFTPDQVAEWTRQGLSLTRDIGDAAQRIAENIEPLLSGDERLILERDLESMRKRQATIDALAKRWMSGAWEPAEWGMEDDPIARRYAPAPIEQGSEVRGRAAGGAPWVDRVGSPSEHRPRTPNTHRGRLLPPAAHDPSTWATYVAGFKKRFALDAGQCSAADSIHTELVGRAEQYLETHWERLAAIHEGDRATHAGFEPVRSLYAELIDRLQAIPTTSQRERVKE